LKKTSTLREHVRLWLGRKKALVEKQTQQQRRRYVELKHALLPPADCKRWPKGHMVSSISA
jgi:hypothetical protein